MEKLEVKAMFLTNYDSEGKLKQEILPHNIHLGDKIFELMYMREIPAYEIYRFTITDISVDNDNIVHITFKRDNNGETERVHINYNPKTDRHIFVNTHGYFVDEISVYKAVFELSKNDYVLAEGAKNNFKKIMNISKEEIRKLILQKGQSNV